MPIYEYLCTACGKPTEILQRMSDPPALECPHCKAQALVKQMSAAGFRLKGGGWYETDFKSDGKRNLAGDGDSAAPAAAEAASSKEKAGAPAAAAPPPPASPAASSGGSSSGSGASGGGGSGAAPSP